MRLKDKVVIITGGARGIGRAYCLGVAAEGARVVVADIADPKPTVKEVEGDASSKSRLAGVPQLDSSRSAAAGPDRNHRGGGGDCLQCG